jgi:hypothetical protein
MNDIGNLNGNNLIVYEKQTSQRGIKLLWLVYLALCPGRELNPHQRLRSPLFYPLNYQGRQKNYSMSRQNEPSHPSRILK